jgi:hypothetical protein
VSRDTAENKASWDIFPSRFWQRNHGPITLPWRPCNDAGYFTSR